MICINSKNVSYLDCLWGELYGSINNGFLRIFAKIALLRSVFAKQSQYALTICKTDAIIMPLSIILLLQSMR